jgi:hypothetical protein
MRPTTVGVSSPRSRCSLVSPETKERRKLGVTLMTLRVRGALLVFLFALTGWVVFPENAFSDAKCFFSDALGATFVPSEDRGGEFQIALSVNDFHDVKQVQKHFVYATVWARLLASQLAADTGGLCNAVIGPYLFPNLHVFLIAHRARTGAISDPASCVHSLEKVAKSQPSAESISAAALKESQTISRRFSSPVGYIGVEDNILKIALRQIYGPDTFMNALVSISTNSEAFHSLDPVEFQAWLQAQQSGGRSEVNPIAICAPDTNPKSDRVAHPRETLPYSNLAAAGLIRLSTTDTGPVVPPTLRHVIIVGDSQDVANAPHPSLTIDDYCNKQHSLPNHTQARIHCLEAMALNIDTWTMLFCDADDCTSESAAESVMAAVAKDQAVITSAEGSLARGQARGPYLVAIE